jgi:hypothetical protein
MKSPVCSRCGQESKLQSEWDERIETGQGVSIIKHQQYVCPDESCQVKVEKILLERKKVAEEREQAAKEREELRSSHSS